LAGCYEYSNEPADSIKRGEFLDHMSNYQLLENDSAELFVLDYVNMRVLTHVR